jgi:AraC-like DNA-binding protein
MSQLARVPPRATTPQQAHLFYREDHAHGAPFYASPSLEFFWPEWMRRVDYHEILAVAEGEGLMVTRSADGLSRRYDLRPGRMFLLRPQDTTYIRPAEGGRLELAYVEFPTESWRAFAAVSELDAGWASGGPTVGSFDPRDPGALEPFRRVARRLADGPRAFDLVEFWVAVVPSLVLAPTGGEGSRAVPAWLAHSAAAMADDENLRVGLPRLLALAHVSAPYLSRSVRRYFGCTPTELISDLRLHRASRLLATTAYPVGDISERCGFASLSYFGRVFRERYGRTPREYRVEAKSHSL